MVDELTLSFNSSHGPKITEFSWIAPQTKSYRNYQGADFHTSGLIRKLKYLKKGLSVQSRVSAIFAD